jgi:hypothetical protein
VGGRYITRLRYYIIKMYWAENSNVLISASRVLHPWNRDMTITTYNSYKLYVKLVCSPSLLAEWVTYASVKYSKKETMLQCSGILYPRSYHPGFKKFKQLKQILCPNLCIISLRKINYNSVPILKGSEDY